jgi:hypothetical protein
MKWPSALKLIAFLLVSAVMLGIALAMLDDAIHHVLSAGRDRLS